MSKMKVRAPQPAQDYKPPEASIKRTTPLFLCQIVLHSNIGLMPQVNAYPAKGQCAQGCQRGTVPGKVQWYFQGLLIHNTSGLSHEHTLASMTLWQGLIGTYPSKDVLHSATEQA